MVAVACAAGAAEAADELVDDEGQEAVKQAVDHSKTALIILSVMCTRRLPLTRHQIRESRAVVASVESVPKETTTFPSLKQLVLNLPQLRRRTR